MSISHYLPSLAWLQNMLLLLLNIPLRVVLRSQIAVAVAFCNNVAKNI
ncbi:hypothetical protein GBAR_LOCUS12498, partial [Geodia barretti]